jgi:hypothetical protein
MRNAILLLLAVLSLVSFATFAQETETISRTIFKLSPQHFIHNSLKAGIERFNTTHSGSFAFFATGRLENADNAFLPEGYDGLAGEIQFRKYISPMKLRTSRKNNTYHQGIYGAAYLQGGSYSGGFSDEYSFYDPNTGQYVTQYNYSFKESVTNYGFGFALGYQKTVWQVVFLEAFVGGGIQFSQRTISGNKPEQGFFGYSGIADPGFEGILPKIGLHIGIGL